MSENLYNLIVILGPTATGKTSLAAKLAHEFKGEIISADSRQVYRGMDIGTGKDYEDYVVNGEKIPHHLIDVIEPADEFNLFLFKEYFYKAFNDITNREKLPFLVGGTGLYLNAILMNYDLQKADFDEDEIKRLKKVDINSLQEILRSLNPSLHNTTDLKDKERIIKAILIHQSDKAQGVGNPIITPLIIGVMLEREEIKKRITERLKKRLNEGMIAEVEQLIKSGLTFEKLNFFGLEYKFIGQHLAGELNFNDMFQKLNSAIHNFAKRQMTWFRKMEKEGVKIYWLNGPDLDSAKELLMNNLPGFSKS